MTSHQPDVEDALYQLIPQAPPIDPTDIDSGEAALEVVILWGELSILHVEHLCPPRAFCVGEALDAKHKPETDFLIGSESLGTARLPVVVESGVGFAVVIPSDAAGQVVLEDRVLPLDASTLQQLSPCPELTGARLYPLRPGETVQLSYRGFTFVVKPLSAARRVGIGEAQRPELRSHIWSLASCALHASALLLFYCLPPRAAALSLDLLDSDSRLVRYMVEPPETVVEDAPVWLNNEHDDQGGSGQRHEGDEGTMGKTDTPHVNRRYGVAGPPNNPKPELARSQAKTDAATAGIIGVLQASVGAWNSPTSPFGAESAHGADPQSAMGALMGPQIGDNGGLFGLGMHGTGRGGGGMGEGTIGIGKLGTVGSGSGTGSGSGYGNGAGGFHGRTGTVPRLRAGLPDVHGSLSKEVIRRIIGRHIAEVRHCYEQELIARPDLQGRVSIKFMISPTGVVTMAAVESSDLPSAKVPLCVASAVRTWDFPAPEGGVVVVTYPFVFSQAGN